MSRIASSPRSLAQTLRVCRRQWRVTTFFVIARQRVGAKRRQMTGCAKQSMPLRHCEPPGRANARPMTGSAKQSMPLRHCERSEAIHLAAQRKNGLLRRFAPLRKRFAFVAGNDEEARASRHRLREARSKGLDCFVAELLAMTV